MSAAKTAPAGLNSSTITTVSTTGSTTAQSSGAARPPLQDPRIAARARQTSSDTAKKSNSGSLPTSSHYSFALLPLDRTISTSTPEGNASPVVSQTTSAGGGVAQASQELPSFTSSKSPSTFNAVNARTEASISRSLAMDQRKDATRDLAAAQSQGRPSSSQSPVVTTLTSADSRQAQLPSPSQSGSVPAESGKDSLSAPLGAQQRSLITPMDPESYGARLGTNARSVPVPRRTDTGTSKLFTSTSGSTAAPLPSFKRNYGADSKITQRSPPLQTTLAISKETATGKASSKSPVGSAPSEADTVRKIHPIAAKAAFNVDEPTTSRVQTTLPPTRWPEVSFREGTVFPNVIALHDAVANYVEERGGTVKLSCSGPFAYIKCVNSPSREANTPGLGKSASSLDA